MDWQPISTIPATRERFLVGFFGSSGDEVMVIAGDNIREGYYADATHWAYARRPGDSPLVPERLLGRIRDIFADQEECLALAAMRLIQLGEVALAARCNRAQQTMPETRAAAIRTVLLER
jgi:hypothetical protein